ncbi:hypothetical protein FHR22_000600 [Sphingopyxis panaciterrae]|uniref:aminoglycoside phosphotransferase family protein n=1 Tax=Sphingopyxis panaciterrae TaxID=363841 RepID=UPI00142295A8|nr:aminoglycoside phosphotransferase family protein [Sphingopyxis panaciterrae]NIJ35951.1 hypothetical protein [Sphingopyxis panaciterrae]
MLSKLFLAGRKAEIALHAHYDKLVRPAARTIDDIPWSWEAITPEWMTATLCREVPGGKVTRVTPAGGSVGSSTRQGFILDLNDAARTAGVPAQIFTKSTPILMQRLLLGLSNCLFGEVGFYRDFRPQIDMEAPAGYWACVDARSMRSMIVMEDVVATRQADFIMDGAAVNRDEMASLLTGLARLHARFWKDASLAEHSWLRGTPSYLGDNDRFLRMAYWAGLGMEAAPELIPPAVRGRIDALWDGVVRRNAREAARGNFTLLHGDAHIAQTYRTASGAMGFCDWQVMLRGPWAWDVSYIMSTGLEIEDRRAWEEELLRLYLGELAAAGGPALDWNEAWDAYRANMPYAFLAWAFTIGHNSVVQAVQPETTTRRLVERTAAAMADLGSIDLNLAS